MAQICTNSHTDTLSHMLSYIHLLSDTYTLASHNTHSHITVTLIQAIPALTAAGSRHSSPASDKMLSPACIPAVPDGCHRSAPHTGSAHRQMCWPHSVPLWAQLLAQLGDKGYPSFLLPIVFFQHRRPFPKFSWAHLDPTSIHTLTCPPKPQPGIRPSNWNFPHSVHSVRCPHSINEQTKGRTEAANRGTGKVTML